MEPVRVNWQLKAILPVVLVLVAGLLLFMAATLSLHDPDVLPLVADYPPAAVFAGRLADRFGPAGCRVLATLIAAGVVVTVPGT